MSILAVSSSPSHTFSKPNQASITLVVGHGVQGDCHAGPTVQHRSRLKIRPAPPNLRQVHLMQYEILEEVLGDELRSDGNGSEEGLSSPGFGSTFGGGHAKLLPGQLGENITTVGIDLLGLGEGTVLRFVVVVDDDGGDGDKEEEEEGKEREQIAAAAAAAVRITGLRNPCPQIENFRKGLQECFIVRDQQRKIVARKAGVMGVVESGGEVRPGMRIVVVEDERSEGFKPLGCV